MYYKTYDANTAKSYASVGLVFYVLAALGGVVTILGISWVISGSIRNWRGPWWPSPAIPAFAIGVLGLIFVLNIIFVSLAYLTYKRIEEGNYTDARAIALILGIFGLFPLFGWFFGGVFFLLTFGKLGEVLRRAQTQITTPSPTPTPVARPTPTPTSAATPSPAPAPVAKPTPTPAPVIPPILTPSPAAKSTPLPVITKFCVSCGNAVDMNDKYCARCGVKLPA